MAYEKQIGLSVLREGNLAKMEPTQTSLRLFCQKSELQLLALLEKPG